SESGGRDATGLLVLVVTAVLVGARAGFAPQYQGYSIYYNGLSVVGLLVIVTRLPRATVAPGRGRRAHALAAALLVPVALSMVVQAADPLTDDLDAVELASDRGRLGLPRSKLATYRAATRFMEEARRRGEQVMLVPEDTTLYFLAGLQAPTRASVFTPGLVTPGRMTEETIAQIEAAPVRYLLVSTRTFPEYGAPLFGFDFNDELADHLLRHYREVGPLVASGPDFAAASRYPMTVWERIDR
ncbi:MAG: hypothetical protein M3527_10770, partial [Actinomycetota bacterium]|nr:hypothetical protein [Actinomycetota bacterium]